MLVNPVIQKDIGDILSDIKASACEGKTFLISGAGGSMARYIVYTLMELKRIYGMEFCTVLALCRSVKKAQEIFEEYLKWPGFQILYQSVEEPVNYEKNIDYIIHAAGNSATRLFKTQPVETAISNLLGTYMLLKLAEEKSVEGFLFFSSGAVYGNTFGVDHDIKEDEYYTINLAATDSCYSLSKKMGEKLCFSFFEEYHVPAKIVRISHTYGPGIDLDDGHVYSDFVRSLLRCENLVIHGDGQDKRAFCYVSDAVRAFFKILLEGTPGQAYNMANNKEYIAVAELADILCKSVAINKNSNIIIEKTPLFRDKQFSLDTGKLEKLGWTPNIPVSEGFQRTLEYFSQG